MPNNVYYVFDDKLCKYEGMTKEQIYNAIAEATGATPVDVDEGFISTIVETHNNVSMHFWKGTSAEYAALSTIDPNTYYIISDDTTLDDLQSQIDNLTEQIGNVSVFWCDNTTTADEIEAAVNNGRLPVYKHVFPPIGSIPSSVDFYVYIGKDTLGYYNFSRLDGYTRMLNYAQIKASNNTWITGQCQLQKKIVHKELDLLSTNWSTGVNTVGNLDFDPTQYETVLLADSDSEREYVSDTSKNTRISNMTSNSISISSNDATGNHKVKLVLIP